MTRTTGPGLILGAALAVGSVVPASAGTIAAQAGVGGLTCGTPTNCFGIGSTFDFDGEGGEGFSRASAALSGTAGNGRSRAQIRGNAIVLPNLGVEAFSDANGFITSDAGAMQKYVHRGPDASLFELQLSMDGTVIAAQDDLAALTANAAVVLGPEVDFYVDAATFLLESVALDPDVTLLDEAGIDFHQLGLFNLGRQTASESLSFTLNDGDEFLIWAGLLGRGGRGASADAFGSLTLEFTRGDVSTLTAVGQAVPAPASLGLLGSALLALCLRRRRPRLDTPHDLRSDG